ncbi:uncharacterized protein M8220_017240 isoform 1-T2 [Acridotheres tristis]
MKVAVLSVALLFSILLCLPAQAKATFDGSGGAICAGRVGGIAVGDVAIGEAAGGCIVVSPGIGAPVWELGASWVPPCLAGTGDTPVTSDISPSLCRRRTASNE